MNFRILDLTEAQQSCLSLAGSQYSHFICRYVLDLSRFARNEVLTGQRPYSEIDDGACSCSLDMPIKLVIPRILWDNNNVSTYLFMHLGI